MLTFLDDRSLMANLIAVAAFFALAAIFIVGLRFYVRIFLKPWFGVDDALALTCLVFLSFNHWLAVYSLPVDNVQRADVVRFSISWQRYLSSWLLYTEGSRTKLRL